MSLVQEGEQGDVLKSEVALTKTVLGVPVGDIQIVTDIDISAPTAQEVHRGKFASADLDSESKVESDF